MAGEKPDALTPDAEPNVKYIRITAKKVSKRTFQGLSEFSPVNGMAIVRIATIPILTSKIP